MNLNKYKNQTIDDMYYRDEEGELVVEFNDGTRLLISIGLSDGLRFKEENNDCSTDNSGND